MDRRTAIAVGIGAIALLGVGLATGLMPPPGIRAFEPIHGCAVEDGDTLLCGKERVRLMGIDAPEVAGRCRPKECPPGDPRQSINTLVDAVAGDITVQRWGLDRYGRTLAVMRANGNNLACHQLRLRHAVYKPQWDQGDGVHRDCPDIATR